MNKYSFPLLLVLFCLFSSTLFAQTWTSVNAGTRNNLTQIVFADALNGYVIADKPLDSVTNALILKSSDGGYHWRTVLARNSSLSGIDFISADTGVVISKHTLDSSYKTFNGGVSWISAKLKYDVGSFIHMNTSKEWVFLRGQSWGYTKDGGASWVDSSRGNAGILPITTYEFLFIDDTTTMMLGGYPQRWVKSKDRGFTWGEVGGLPFGVVASGCFPNPSLGFFASSMGTTTKSYKMYKTVNGGASWTKIDSVVGQFINCIRHKDADTLYAVGKNGFITRSVDGGASWVQEASGTTQHLTKVLVLPNNVIAIGDSGTILLRTYAPVGVSSVGADEKEIVVYPNPGQGWLTISNNMAGLPALNFVLNDAQGKMLLQQTLEGKTNQVDISVYPVGTYFYQLSVQGRAVKTGQFVRN
jgi:photosystem II stability/assembly factor-like uncharacterized protein